MTIDGIVIFTILAGSTVILYEQSSRIVDDHRVINLTGQLPTVSVFPYKLNNLIIMTCLKDRIAVFVLGDLAKGDINIIHCPVIILRHIDGMIVGQILRSVLSQDQLNLARRILLVN